MKLTFNRIGVAAVVAAGSAVIFAAIAIPCTFLGSPLGSFVKPWQTVAREVALISSSGFGLSVAGLFFCGYLVRKLELEELRQSPLPCRGCSHYHGRTYYQKDTQQGNFFCCAMHPYGPSDEFCQDWEA